MADGGSKKKDAAFLDLLTQTHADVQALKIVGNQ